MSIPCCVAGMSILTRTDLPSKKSRNTDSSCAEAGSDADTTTTAAKHARCMVSMRGILLDLDQRLVQVGPPALRALPRLGDLVLAEGVAAVPAARGLDPHRLARGLGRFQQVFQVILHFVAGELEFVGDG